MQLWAAIPCTDGDRFPLPLITNTSSALTRLCDTRPAPHSTIGKLTCRRKKMHNDARIQR